MLRVSLGIVYCWFGLLKVVPGLSPAENLAGRTIAMLTSGLLPQRVALLALAAWECALGASLVLGLFRRTTVALTCMHLLGTSAPLFLMPRELFVHVPFAPGMLGQYIIKNIVLFSAAVTVAGARGNRALDSGSRRCHGQEVGHGEGGQSESATSRRQARPADGPGDSSRNDCWDNERRWSDNAPSFVCHGDTHGTPLVARRSDSAPVAADRQPPEPPSSSVGVTPSIG